MSRLLLLALALATGASGCMSAELARVRRDLAADLPQASIARGHAPAFGRLTMGLANLVVPNDADVNDILVHVRSGSFGRYNVGTLPNLEAADAPRALARARARGWAPVVTVREDSSAVWILARTARDGTVGDLMVWNLDEEGLTLVRVTGRLEDLVASLAARGRLPNGVGEALGRAPDEQAAR